MTTLTAELRQEIEKAGDVLVRIEDPETHASYVLLKAEVYERIKPAACPQRRAVARASGVRREPELR